MKYIICFLLTSLLLTSCSSENDSDPNNFFNLNEGNLWVYKNYYSNDNLNYTYTNQIDSVRVTGDTLISGISFSKLQHKVYATGILNWKWIEILRVNSEGHLVNQNNIVRHPGTDSASHSVRDILAGGIVNIGSLSEQLQDPFTTNVEGTDYFVYSYYGIYIPIDSIFPNSYTFSQYVEGLGLVSQHIPAANGYSCTEERLVYYELN